MKALIEYLPFLIPIIIIQLALQITALIHVLKHPHYKFGSKQLWVVIVIFGEIVGAIVYFIFGKGEDE